MKGIIVLVVAVLMLNGCANPPKYPATPQTSAALKKTLLENINVGAITPPEGFNRICRIQGAITPPDYRMSFEEYLQNALIEEIKAAERFDDKTARITLSGDLDKLYLQQRKARPCHAATGTLICGSNRRMVSQFLFLSTMSSKAVSLR